jgi:hypothetical protein
VPAALPAHFDIRGGITFNEPSNTTVLDSYAIAGSVMNSRPLTNNDVQHRRSWHGRAGSGVAPYRMHGSNYAGSSNIAHVFESGGQQLRSTASVLTSFIDFEISGPVGATSVLAPINFHLSGQQILRSYTSVSGFTSSVQVILSDGYFTSALSVFGKKLNFATERPVFNLPAGYTVNSVDAGAVNNVSTTPLPVPTTDVLATLGLLVVARRVQRRRCFSPPHTRPGRTAIHCRYPAQALEGCVELHLRHECV